MGSSNSSKATCLCKNINIALWTWWMIQYCCATLKGHYVVKLISVSRKFWIVLTASGMTGPLITFIKNSWIITMNHQNLWCLLKVMQAQITHKRGGKKPRGHSLSTQTLLLKPERRSQHITIFGFPVPCEAGCARAERPISMRQNYSTESD